MQITKREKYTCIECSVHKKVTDVYVESIRVIESSRGASYQIHHPNDFLVCGRMLGFSYVTTATKFDRESIVINEAETSERIIFQR